MPSLKNPDPGSLCKKWGVRVRHVDCNHFLAKKTFFATTRVVPFFSGNSKGDPLNFFFQHLSPPTTPRGRLLIQRQVLLVHEDHCAREFLQFRGADDMIQVPVRDQDPLAGQVLPGHSRGHEGKKHKSYVCNGTLWDVSWCIS